MKQPSKRGLHPKTNPLIPLSPLSTGEGDDARNVEWRRWSHERVRGEEGYGAERADCHGPRSADMTIVL
jgi:hypothetical protein